MSVLYGNRALENSLSKLSATYAKALSAGISRMRASGELRQILDRYGIKDWK